MDLVTGGSGLVGSHLLYLLTKQGNAVRATLRNKSNISLVRKLFSYYSPEDGDSLFERIEWVDGDVTDIVSIQDALQGIKKVYHCAAVVSFQPSDRKNMLKINVDGTANMVNASLDAGIEKFIHCSSVASLGQPLTGNFIDESHIWKTSQHNSWYAISKYGAEREVWRGAEEGLNTVIVNPSIVLGPGDTSRSSGQLYLSAKKGFRFYTKGITGFVDVRDVADRMVRLAQSDICGQRFILNSDNLEYKKVFEYFAIAAGVKPPNIYAGPFLSSIAWRLEKVRSLLTGTKPLITRETARNANSIRLFSNSKITQAIEIPFLPIEEAVENTVNFYKQYPDLA